MTHQRDHKHLFNERPEGIDTEIDPADVMDSEGLDRRTYFGHGQQALRCVRLALLAGMKSEVRSILDLPCGHGRILRSLKAAFPDASLTACDIDRDGVDFCVRRFGATGVYSTPDPADIEIEGKFDLIYCGSLLTHLDESGWDGFLSFFERVLEHDGVLVFTTGGRNFAEQIRAGRRDFGLGTAEAQAMVADYERSGFGYRGWPHATGYGMAMAKPWWICRKLEQFPTLRLLTLTELRPQDVTTFMKGPIEESAQVNR